MNVVKAPISVSISAPILMGPTFAPATLAILSPAMGSAAQV